MGHEGGDEAGCRTKNRRGTATRCTERKKKGGEREGLGNPLANAIFRNIRGSALFPAIRTRAAAPWPRTAARPRELRRLQSPCGNQAKLPRRRLDGDQRTIDGVLRNLPSVLVRGHGSVPIKEIRELASDDARRDGTKAPAVAERPRPTLISVCVVDVSVPPEKVMGIP